MMITISTAERAVIKKDFREVWDSKMARSTMLVVPLMLVILIPIVCLVININVPASEVNGIDKIMQMLPPEAQNFDVRQGTFYMMTNTMFPMFFLMIPLMTSSVSAASSFVGERERGTLETLILTPMTLPKIFRAKVLGCIALSALITTISFVAFAIVMSIGDIMLGMPFFLNWNWLVCVLLFAPAVTVFGVVFMVLVSAKSKNFIEAMQTSGYIVLPIVLIFAGEMTGLFSLSALHLLLISVVVIILDAVIWVVTSRSFRAEKLLR
jgi:ABC-type Na+ efflux pump permease subunit